MVLLIVPAAAAYPSLLKRRSPKFFASNGTLVIDPDVTGPLFEVPIVTPPLPEGLNFIP